MNCPFCLSELRHLDIVEGAFGPAVEFECVNTECEEGRYKEFLCSLNEEDLEW